jgi:hypothetical protein
LVSFQLVVNGNALTRSEDTKEPEGVGRQTGKKDGNGNGNGKLRVELKTEIIYIHFGDKYRQIQK